MFKQYSCHLWEEVEANKNFEYNVSSFMCRSYYATNPSPSMTSSTAIQVARSDMEGLLGRGVSGFWSLTGWVVKVGC